MRLSLIAALTPNRVIGLKNQLPWRLPADLQHFKQLTVGKPIIMGRKTHESIGKALPGRLNIVVSRNRALLAEGCEVVVSLEAALALVSQSEEVMVIGGAQLYEQALPQAQRLYLTLIQQDFAGDRFFPPWSSVEWREVSREDCVADAANPYPFSFLILERTEKH